MCNDRCGYAPEIYAPIYRFEQLFAVYRLYEYDVAGFCSGSDENIINIIGHMLALTLYLCFLYGPVLPIPE